MFWNKKPSVKQSVTLKHRNGESITITVEGTNLGHIDYVIKRIKETFHMKPFEKMPTQDELDEIWDEAEKVFRDFGDLFKR